MKNKSVKTEIFINECSLQGQFQIVAELEEAVKNVISILELIIKKSNLYSELYGVNLFFDFKAIKSETFPKSFNKLERDTQLKFKKLLFDKLKDWRNQRVHQSIDQYTLVETSQKVTDTSIAEVTERKLQKADLAYLLVNFSGSHFQEPHPTFRLCHSIDVVKNQTQPKIHLDCLDSKSAFEEWVQDKLNFLSFLEREADRFKKTSHVFQGQPVYIEIKNGHYWYLDNFHKNHFEVFNSQGEHLGEADLEGILDINKRDRTKKFKDT